MRCWFTVSLASAACVLLLTDSLSAQQIRRAERLVGGNENPPLASDGSGRFRARLFEDRIEYRLRYDVASETEEGPSDITQAHLHIGNPGTNGGVVAFLCSNDPPDGVTTPECPDSPDEVEGDILAADVLPNTDAMLLAGDLAGLSKLIRQGAVYVNVHTNRVPSGEIRAQLSPRRR